MTFTLKVFFFLFLKTKATADMIREEENVAQKK